MCEGWARTTNVYDTGNNLEESGNEKLTLKQQLTLDQPQMVHGAWCMVHGAWCMVNCWVGTLRVNRVFETPLPIRV